MARMFEVGKSYYCNDSGFNPITVIRRTDKTIWVDNTENKWRMRIKHDINGNEYVCDSLAPHGYRDIFTYTA